MKSENRNFLYNIIYQLLTFIIPLITVPYISRTLGVENVGIYSYTYSIVYLFMLVGMLGINNYGNRSIAANREDVISLSKTFFSIYFLQMLVNLIVIVLYAIYIVFICTEYWTISLIQGLFLLSICFDINWFYFGIEKFKITISRNLIIKIASVVLIFTLVNDENDLIVYTLIMAGATLFSQLYLILLLPKYVVKCKVSLHEVFIHFKDVFILFIPVLAFGIYRVMDKTMIGALANVQEVAYYENAEKIINIPIAIISALGTVMLPRMSYLYSKGNCDYDDAIAPSMKLATKLSVIMFWGIILIADDAVIVLFGESFQASAPILKILSVTVLASGWANVIRTQHLIPLKKDNIYVTSTVIAALFNFVLNIIFIKRFAAIGACIGTVVAEFFIAIYQSIKCRNLNFRAYLFDAFKEIFIDLLIVTITYLLTIGIENIVLRFIVRIIVAIVLFFTLNQKYIIKDFFGKC